jgi:hypothetical protein
MEVRREGGNLMVKIRLRAPEKGSDFPELGFQFFQDLAGRMNAGSARGQKFLERGCEIGLGAQLKTSPIKNGKTG